MSETIKAAKALFQASAFRAAKAIEIPRCKFFWTKTENPLYVWRAYQICREIECDLPAWVLNYFDKSANYLLNEKFKYEGNGVQSNFYEALGMRTTGQGVTPWKEYKDIERRMSAVCMVSRIKEDNPQMTYELIYNDVAEEFSKDGIKTTARMIEGWQKELKLLIKEPIA